MSSKDHKILLVLQSEVYQAGLANILEPDYEVLNGTFEFGKDPSTLAYQGLIRQNNADLVIIGFEQENIQASLNVGARFKTIGVEVFALVFNSEDWIVRKILYLNPRAVVYYMSPSHTIKKAVEKALHRESFADDRLAELLISLTSEKRVAIEEELTIREREVVSLIEQNLTNKEIASNLSISERTVKYHCQNIYRRAGVHNRSELIKLLHSTNSSA